MKKKLRKIDKFLEIPKEIYSNDAKITIIGFDEVIIENFESIELERIVEENGC